MAQKTQGTAVAVATATAATKAISAATATNPVNVTATAHGYANGDIAYIDSVGGMTQLNKRSFVVANSTTNAFDLKGEDGTGYTAYTAGGTAAKKTMTGIGECAGVGPGFDGEASEIDVTHLLSTAKEFLMGLQDFGNVPLTVFLTSPNDTGQTRMRALKRLAQAETFTITLPSGQVAAFNAFVKSFPFQNISPDSAFQGSPGLRCTGEPGWFA